MAGRLSSGAVAAGLIGLNKPAGGGGGSAYDVSPPAATTEAVAAGSSLSAKTFGSFTGADAASIDGYTLRTVNAAGSTSWSGSGLGPWTPSGDADGNAGVIALDATIGGVVVATALHDYARAAASGAGLSTLLDVDFTALSAYDFLTTGGTSGTGGDGPHTVGGLTWYLDGSAGLTQLEITAAGLEMSQSSGAFVLGLDVRALATPLDPAGPVHVITRVANAVSGTSSDGVQVSMRRGSTVAAWTTGDAAIRYRRADATPDLYAIAYNGSSYDVHASGTVTASSNVRMQLSFSALRGLVARGDTGTTTDPADFDTLPEFAWANYAQGLAAFSGSYPASGNCWVSVAAGANASGTFKTLTVYGLEG